MLIQIKIWFHFLGHFRDVQRSSDAFIHTHHIFIDPIVYFVREIKERK